jgi:hypothetical protein
MVGDDPRHDRLALVDDDLRAGRDGGSGARPRREDLLPDDDDDRVVDHLAPCAVDETRAAKYRSRRVLGRSGSFPRRARRASHGRYPEEPRKAEDKAQQ